MSLVRVVKQPLGGEWVSGDLFRCARFEAVFLVA